MLNIKNITIKNFMSVGNVTQAVHFNTQPLTLVLGVNVDLGGDDNRNGTGKTTIVNALSYALYGQALTNIRKDNLINKTNNRHMLVTVDFEKDGNNYRIERGRRPNKFVFLVNDNERQESTDEMQGEGRLGQEQIVRILGLSHTMFKHVIALNTYTEPFLSMRANDQREVIEQLLGITQLSEKAALLKELVKTTKESIMGEEYRIKAVESANKKIEDSIKDLERRSSIWLRRLEEDIQVCTEGIIELQKIDTEEELTNHALLTEYKEKQNTITNIETKQTSLVTQENREDTRLTQAEKDLEATKEHKCYACGQELHDDAHKKILLAKETTITESQQHITELQTSFKLLTTQRQEIGELGTKPEVNYDSIHDVYDHKNTLENLIQQLENKNNDENPYVDQIDTLKKKGLQEVDWEEVNELNRLLDHQEFLLKLLTNKDSFIRKRIIEQNLNYLNHRLEYYLSRLGLPHEVSFQSDLNVEITELGRSLDFDNLSRGERNRLILGLSWAFRDVFESLNHPINLLAIDELIDSGMDTNGVENSLSVLKKISRERKKNVFLISHRDELVGRVNTILYVIKENGFTSFSTDVELETV
jgi:DNA repair exonuclease SbcCD ATPase subunit